MVVFLSHDGFVQNFILPIQKRLLGE